MEPVGSVAGASSETRFSFSVSDTRLRRGEYVKVAHEEGLALAIVRAINREKDGLVAHAGVLGARDGRGLLVTPKTPFRPGDKVWVADDRLIGDVLGLGDAGAASGEGAFLGLLRGHNIKVNLDIDLLVQKHVSVMAKTGAGKSYVVGVLIEELLKRQVPVIIVDPHGEYTSLAQPNNAASETQAMRRFGVRPRAFADRVLEYSPDTKVNADAQPMRVDGTNLQMGDLTDLMGGKVSAVQLGLLHQAIKDVAARRKKGYTLQDIIAEVNKNESNAKWTLLGALQYLEGLGLFADQGTPVASLVKRGQVTVLNLRGSPPEVQEIVVAWLCKNLFEARKLNQVPPLMLVVEEAHHFCPERGFTQARSSDVLRTIASEGRKFGLGLCVVSQRPAKVDKNVLSQANTQVILKVTNPNDLKAIIASVEGLTRDSEDEIQQLPVGTALVSHPRYPMPIQVEIRPRETRHGGRSVSVLESWNEDPVESEKPGESEKPAQADKADEADEADEADTPADAAKAGAGLARAVLPPAAPADEASLAPAGDIEAPDVRDVRDVHEGPEAEAWELPPAPPREPAPEPKPTLLAPPPGPVDPTEAAAITDLRALFHHVLREDLSGARDDGLAEALAILQGKEATLRGLRVEFPGAAEVEELERLHRAAMTRLRLAVDERRRQRGLLGKLRGAKR